MACNVAWFLVTDVLLCVSVGIFTHYHLTGKNEKSKKRNYAVSGRSLGRNVLLMPEVRGGWPDWFDTKQRQKYHAEDQLLMPNMTNLAADGLQQMKTTLSATTVG